MSGIAGIVNYKKDISDDASIRLMSLTMKKRSGGQDGFYFSKCCNLVQKNNICFDDARRNNILTMVINEITYVIVCDGELYNKQEMIKRIKEKGMPLRDESDIEVILKSYIIWNKGICNMLNGVYSFAIWNVNKKEMFVVRDRFGIRPLYYLCVNDNFVFGSEIKTVLEHPEMDVTLNVEGINELLAIGPCHTAGKTPFKNVFEVKPASFIVINEDGVHEEKYWTLKSKKHEDTLEKTAENIRELIKDSIKRQMIMNSDTGILLSGGLDSSIIAKFASEFYKEEGIGKIQTFSVDYKDQEKNFIRNEFQPNTDDYYIDLMVSNIGSKHKKIVLDTPELADYLEDAMIARGYPGMADVDSSYLLLFKELKSDINVALSGECSDEIFGGYPWYFKEELMNSNTFPWSNFVCERQKFINKELTDKIDLKGYSDLMYQESLKEIDLIDGDSPETKKHKTLMYLTMNWFMQTLIDRTDRMCSYSGMSARVPFCDYRLVEYAWNIPWEMKSYTGREKGLLRYSMQGYLPDEVIYRKKSPYPKTHNPNYLTKVVEMFKKILDDNDSKIKLILDEKYLRKLIDLNEDVVMKPWFGQLMTRPQLIAYFIQLEMWFRRYNPSIEI